MNVLNLCRICEGSGELVLTEHHGDGRSAEHVIGCFNCDGMGVGGQ